MSVDYLSALDEMVEGYHGRAREVVALAPAFARLLFSLLREPRLGRRERLQVDAAIAYLVATDDVIPEGEVGPYGYIDDIFCCAFVAHGIGTRLGWDLVEDAWGGPGSIRETSERILGREQELLGCVGDDVLRYAGLSEPVEAPEAPAAAV
jgi:uncharacterized membrane protein YkvA (DUF1232 family)